MFSVIAVFPVITVIAVYHSLVKQGMMLNSFIGTCTLYFVTENGSLIVSVIDVN